MIRIPKSGNKEYYFLMAVSMPLKTTKASNIAATCLKIHN